MADEQNLDGKTPVKAVPFDAHEQATRGTYAPAGEDVHPGQGQQYPKAVDHVDGEPILVNGAEEEQAYLAKNAPAPAAEPTKSA